MIYLDNAATSFPKSEAVYAEMDRVNRTLSVNPGRGSYKTAREANDIITELRAAVLTVFHAQNIGNTILTPSITHAINEVLTGLNLQSNDVVYITPYEHNAVARCVELLRNRIGFKVEFIPLLDDLQIDVEKTKYMFSVNQPTHVIINALSNVTGYVLPIKELCEVAKQYKCVTMIDTAQAAGVVDINLTRINADIVFFAGHKSLGGPIGIGGFVLKDEIVLDVAFAGGTGSDSLNLNMPAQAPNKYEASSSNVVAMAGLLAALKDYDIEKHCKKIRSLTDYALQRLKDVPKIRIVGETPNQLGVVSFVCDGYNSNDIGEILDNEFDIAVRTGYHCCPYIHHYLNDEPYGGTVRVGLGMQNDYGDIDTLEQALRTI